MLLSRTSLPKSVAWAPRTEDRSITVPAKEETDFLQAGWVSLGSPTLHHWSWEQKALAAGREPAQTEWLGHMQC